MKVYTFEVDLENDCTQAAKDVGAEHRKLDVGTGSKGWLDHAYWLPDGRHFIVEFKLPGEPLKPKQNKRALRLRDLGHRVYVIDTYENFLMLLETST